MADQLPPLPPGFKLDQRPTKENAAKLPPLPEGFSLDQPNIEKASILPFSKNVDTGEVSFDLTAGIPGLFWEAFKSGSTAMEDVAEGRLDPTGQEAINRTRDAALMATPVSPAVRVGERAIPGVLKSLKPGEPKVPSAEALKAAGGAGFRKAEGMGVDYPTASIKSMVDDLTRQLESKGIREKRAPDTFSLFNEIKSGPDDSVVSLTGLREIRAALSDIAGDFGPSAKKTDRKAAQDAIRALDSFMEEPPASGVVVGTGFSNGGTAVARATPEDFSEAVQRLRAARERAVDAGATIKEANANYAAAERSNTVSGKIKKAELSAAAANSGLNLDNRTRQILLAIIDPERPRNRRGYSKEELALIEDIVNGKHGANAARWLGNFLGGGGGWGAFSAAGVGSAAGAGIGALLAGPTGAAVGAPAGGALPLALGRMFKGLSNKITSNRAQRLDEQIRMRSPLYQKAVENPPMEVVHPTIQDILTRALMMQQAAQGGQP
jgi:RNase H-fold protein (predicted Holliday junction resolvase)